MRYKVAQQQAQEFGSVTAADLGVEIIAAAKRREQDIEKGERPVPSNAQVISF